MPQPFAVLEAKDSPGGFLRDLMELSGERSPGGPAEDNGQKPGKGPLRGSWEEQERLCRSYTKTLPHTSGETEAQEIKGSGFPLPGSPPELWLLLLVLPITAQHPQRMIITSLLAYYYSYFAER